MHGLLAHAGEDHGSTTEAVAHAAQDPVLLWVILLVVPITIAFFTHHVFTFKLLNTLLSISVFLIAFSVYSYQSPGLHTAAAIAGGFGIVFVTTILRLLSE